MAWEVRLRQQAVPQGVPREALNRGARHESREGAPKPRRRNKRLPASFRARFRAHAFCISRVQEGTFAQRTPGAQGIQMNVPAVYHNALPPNITPFSSPGTLSTSTLCDCWRSTKFPFFRPTNGMFTYTLPL